MLILITNFIKQLASNLAVWTLIFVEAVSIKKISKFWFVQKAFLYYQQKV